VRVSKLLNPAVYQKIVTTPRRELDLLRLPGFASLHGGSFRDALKYLAKPCADAQPGSLSVERQRGEPVNSRYRGALQPTAWCEIPEREAGGRRCSLPKSSGRLWRRNPAGQRLDAVERG